MKFVGGPRVLFSLLALSLLAPLVLSVDGAGAATAPVTPVTSAPNPLNAGGGAVRNAALYYDGTTTLAGASRASLRAKLGNPGVVVTTPKSDEPGTVAAIHSIGAKAYRYVQFYWAPNDAAYEGINLKLHPDWAFCGSGSTKLLGRTTSSGEKWYFIDANEKAVRARFRTMLASYKADGWDGVMFDRGEAATQDGTDAAGHPMWFRQSTCTGQKYKAGATFADAYVNMLGLAHATGLQAMVNNGKSPFDPFVGMRPNPRNAYCRAAKWARCTTLSDSWANLNLVLNETAAHPRDVAWSRDFAGNQLSETNRYHGRRTLALITTATLGGAARQTRANVFYQWSRVKLFNIPVAVNTGDGTCASGSTTSGVCNRYGVYPELTNATFGKPLSTKPAATGCVRPSKVRCVWTRRYAAGMNLVNVTPKPRLVKLALGTSRCRFVYDVYLKRPLAGNACVKSISLRMTPWSGRPLRYSASRW